MAGDPARLDAAREHVEAFVSELNNERHPCECCGLNKFDDLTEHKAFEELTGVVNKLRRWAEQFRE